MRRVLYVACVMSVAVSVPMEPAQAQSVEERLRALEEWKEEEKKDEKKNEFHVFWKDGLNLETDDKAFTMKIGGRIMQDWAFFSQDSDSKALHDNQLDYVEFRRLRMYTSGTIYERVSFKNQIDFAGGEISIKDAYIEINKIPAVGDFRVGHFKEPFSLEELTSSKYITFMERSLPNAFAPGRNAGVMIHNTELDDDRLTWALGVFREVGDDAEMAEDGDYQVTGRITGLPWYEDDGQKLVHVGGAFSYRTPRDRELRFRQRPEIHKSDRFIDTDHFPSERYYLAGAEAALVYHSASVQGELIYAHSMAPAAPDGEDGFTDSSFYGAYVYAGYFLTGEYRRYKNSAGAFDRIKPKENFLKDGGMGAVEVAARYSIMDLDDADAEIVGGRLQNITLGVNWYLNPNTRVMINYIYSRRDEGVSQDEKDDPDFEVREGTAHIGGARFQIDF